MQIRPIRTAAAHRAALLRIEQLWGAKKNTSESDELDILVTLAEAFERAHHPIAPPHPIEAILFRMDQLGLSRADLAAMLGSKSRASEILSRKRRLSLSMLKTIHRKMGVPAESLLAD